MSQIEVLSTLEKTENYNVNNNMIDSIEMESNTPNIELTIKNNQKLLNENTNDAEEEDDPNKLEKSDDEIDIHDKDEDDEANENSDDSIENELNKSNLSNNKFDSSNCLQVNSNEIENVEEDDDQNNQTQINNSNLNENELVKDNDEEITQASLNNLIEDQENEDNQLKKLQQSKDQINSNSCGENCLQNKKISNLQVLTRPSASSSNNNNNNNNNNNTQVIERKKVKSISKKPSRPIIEEVKRSVDQDNDIVCNKFSSNNNEQISNSNMPNSLSTSCSSALTVNSTSNSPTDSNSSQSNNYLNSKASNIVQNRTNSNGKMSPGLAKRVDGTNSNMNNKAEQKVEQLTKVDSKNILANNQDQMKTTDQSEKQNIAKSRSDIKIQNALERNMQKLNLVKKTNGKDAAKVNLTKEEIELFTNNQQQLQKNQLLEQYQMQNNFTSDSLTTTPEHRINLNNNNNFLNYNNFQETRLPFNYTNQFDSINYNHKLQLLAQHQFYHPQNLLLPDATSYYLNRLPNSSIIPTVPSNQIDYTDENMLQFQQFNTLNALQPKNVLLRNSTDREMTPDSIDNSNENPDIIEYRQKKMLLTKTNNNIRTKKPVKQEDLKQQNTILNKRPLKQSEQNNKIVNNSNHMFQGQSDLDSNEMTNSTNMISSFSPSSLSSLSTISSPLVRQQQQAPTKNQPQPSNKSNNKKPSVANDKNRNQINSNHQKNIQRNIASQKENLRQEKRVFQKNELVNIDNETKTKTSNIPNNKIRNSQSSNLKVNSNLKIQKQTVKNPNEKFQGDSMPPLTNNSFNKTVINVKSNNSNILPVLEEGLSNDEESSPTINKNNNGNSVYAYDEASDNEYYEDEVDNENFEQDELDEADNDEYDDQNYNTYDQDENDNYIEQDDETNEDEVDEDEDSNEINDEQEQQEACAEEMAHQNQTSKNMMQFKAKQASCYGYQTNNNSNLSKTINNTTNNNHKTNSNVRNTPNKNISNSINVPTSVSMNAISQSPQGKISNGSAKNKVTSSASTTNMIDTSSSSTSTIKSTSKKNANRKNSNKDYDTDEETNKLLGHTLTNNKDNQIESDGYSNENDNDCDSQGHERQQSKSKEINVHQIMDPDNKVLIEGVLFRARYLGSTQLVTDGNPTKLTRMLQAQEAVGRIKAPEGESQPSVEVDLFVSTEKIMVLNTDLQPRSLSEIMMDHSLRSISYIADIGNLVVLMAKRRTITSSDGNDSLSSSKRQVKMVCHVFESEEAQVVAQSIGQAFQVAYMEYLKANGIEDMSIMKDLDYQEVLNQQEIMGDELLMFAKKECQKEVIVPKQKNEALGVVIVESGWGSMLPTVVVANMMPTGPAARCGHLNIGDQIISVNGISMVGLPLAACQNQIKSAKHLTLVRLVVVPCAPVVEVLIKRPDTKYQLGFSVQDGIICSLLRGGIAERGGVRVGHRIIEINNQSVVATTHEKIVSILANSVGELRMKTMPTQMFRLLTGQETPIYI